MFYSEFSALAVASNWCCQCPASSASFQSLKRNAWQLHLTLLSFFYGRGGPNDESTFYTFAVRRLPLLDVFLCWKLRPSPFAKQHSKFKRVWVYSIGQTCSISKRFCPACGRTIEGVDRYVRLTSTALSAKKSRLRYRYQAGPGNPVIHRAP